MAQQRKSKLLDFLGVFPQFDEAKETFPNILDRNFSHGAQKLRKLKNAANWIISRHR